MPGSYARVNYSLRPAKHVERKMMCEVFRKLSEFGAIESYRYIGFGSIYFSDFLLFHKSLGITNMISMEKGIEDEERFNFNRPFGCIKMNFGESNEILPTLQPWDVRTILWLDYDSALDKNILTDIYFSFSNVCAGSIVIITVNSHTEPSEKDPLENLQKRIGEEKVPSGISRKDFDAWGTAKIYRRIISNEILETLNKRNGGRHKGNKFNYKQLFNLHYADGLRMLTVGGLIYDDGQSGIVEKCEFDKFDFVRGGEDPYRIEIPKLTYREIRYLDTQLPVSDHGQLNHKRIPENDLKRYAQLYRYFPTFAEAEM